MYIMKLDTATAESVLMTLKTPRESRRNQKILKMPATHSTLCLLIYKTLQSDYISIIGKQVRLLLTTPLCCLTAGINRKE